MATGPFLLGIFLVGVLAGAGCAHRAEHGARLGTSDLIPRRPPPPEDPRYAIPLASKRGLTIFLDSQTFEYREDDRVFATGPICSGSTEHPTPAGNFHVLSKEEDKRSGKYTNYFDQNTPMPYSLQFFGPYFIHEGWLAGYADSHGCVRLKYEDAKLLFDRIQVGDPVIVTHQGWARPANPFGDAYPFPVF